MYINIYQFIYTYIYIYTMIAENKRRFTFVMSQPTNRTVGSESDAAISASISW